MVLPTYCRNRNQNQNQNQNQIVGYYTAYCMGKRRDDDESGMSSGRHVLSAATASRRRLSAATALLQRGDVGSGFEEILSGKAKRQG